ncbi:MAG: hypothetical protein WC828_08225 [Thermoleophilia bacterium]|jgi:Tfp pilus assembly protein PilN
MPRVNLVPQEERQRELRRQIYIFPLAGAVLLIAAMGGSYYYFNSELNNKQNELDAKKQLNAQMSKDVAEIAKYDDLKSRKVSRQTAVTNLYSQRFLWSRTLDHISFVMPTDSWLIDIKGNVPGIATNATSKTSSAQKNQAQDLILEGYTYEMGTIATMMIRIGLVPSLKDVVLIKAEKEDLNGRMVVHFSVGANLNQTADTSKTSVAPVTGEQGPSDVTPTTGTTTSPTTGRTTTGSTTRTTGTTSGTN